MVITNPNKSSESFFYPIWVHDFAKKAEFEQFIQKNLNFLAVVNNIQKSMLKETGPFPLPGYCSVCNKVVNYSFTWYFSQVDARGEVHPAWTETCRCPECGLNNRMRAVFDFLITRIPNYQSKQIYIAEYVTAAYKKLAELVKNTIGSEYLGADKTPGKIYPDPKTNQGIRHEDLTRLSFPDKSFDVVITQDVFEHIPGYKTAFSEAARVLKPKGTLVFSIPFFNVDQTVVRARLNQNGEVEHILPPEIHGDPLTSGSLCFQNFGWDILTSLHEAGFSAATASLYWAPWNGHLGFPGFVFRASK
jgi:SAM-dependent methyltransferase